MHKTPEEWRHVKAQAVTAGSVAQATNVLQMALDDIQALAAQLSQTQEDRNNALDNEYYNR